MMNDRLPPCPTVGHGEKAVTLNEFMKRLEAADISFVKRKRKGRSIIRTKGCRLCPIQALADHCNLPYMLAPGIDRNVWSAVYLMGLDPQAARIVIMAADDIRTSSSIVRETRKRLKAMCGEGK